MFSWLHLFLDLTTTGITKTRKVSKDHEEEPVFFVRFVGLRAFVVAFVLGR